MKLLPVLGVIVFLFSCNSEVTKPKDNQETNKKVFQAAVSTISPEATAVGKFILESGGNAFDAAIAVQFALAVAYPRAGNLGGGGFAVMCTQDGEINSIDFREKAPLRASTDMYLDVLGNPIEGKSLIGALASGVPGTVKGLWEMHKKYGSQPWSDLIKPAIQLAEKGFRVSKQEADKLNEYQEEFQKVNISPNGPFFEKNFSPGDTVLQPILAQTLTLIADSGAAGFYQGSVARKMVANIQFGGGVISLEDLKKYEAVFRKPIEGKLNSHKVVSMGPPSSGGVALIQLLNGAQMIHTAGLGHNSGANLHLYTEMMRRVYADRTTHLGDPDFYPVPVEKLVHPEYLMERYMTIKPTEKTKSEDIKAGHSERIESYETTHFSVLDKYGNAVSMTVTLNSNYGCKYFLPSVGFFMNNEMDDFSVKPGVANQFGLIGGMANAIEPEKRMLSSMSPTIVMRDREPVLIIGTPGGSTIITTVFQVIMNVMEFDMPLQEAIDAGRIHHQWQPDFVVYEEGKISGKSINDMSSLGHVMIPKPSLGIVNAIYVSPAGETFAGADTTRYMGSAVVLP